MSTLTDHWKRGKDIERMRVEGQTYKEIGNAFGISTTRVQQIFIKHQRMNLSLLHKSLSASLSFLEQHLLGKKFIDQYDQLHLHGPILP